MAHTEAMKLIAGKQRVFVQYRHDGMVMGHMFQWEPYLIEGYKAIIPTMNAALGVRVIATFAPNRTCQLGWKADAEAGPKWCENCGQRRMLHLDVPNSFDPDDETTW
jgi:hypothetical protein